MIYALGHEERITSDSSKALLKAVILHHTYGKPSIPVAHSAILEETYDSMKLILPVIRYTNHEWNICGD